MHMHMPHIKYLFRQCAWTGLQIDLRGIFFKMSFSQNSANWLFQLELSSGAPTISVRGAPTTTQRYWVQFPTGPRILRLIQFLSLSQHQNNKPTVYYNIQQPVCLSEVSFWTWSSRVLLRVLINHRLFWTIVTTENEELAQWDRDTVHIQLGRCYNFLVAKNWTPSHQTCLPWGRCEFC